MSEETKLLPREADIPSDCVNLLPDLVRCPPRANTRAEGKLPPTTLPFTSVNEAMAAAIERASREWGPIVRRWRGDE